MIGSQEPTKSVSGAYLYISIFKLVEYMILSNYAPITKGMAKKVYIFTAAVR